MLNKNLAEHVNNKCCRMNYFDIFFIHIKLMNKNQDIINYPFYAKSISQIYLINKIWI